MAKTQEQPKQRILSYEEKIQIAERARVSISAGWTSLAGLLDDTSEAYLQSGRPLSGDPLFIALDSCSVVGRRIEEYENFAAAMEKARKELAKPRKNNSH